MKSLTDNYFRNRGGQNGHPSDTVSNSQESWAQHYFQNSSFDSRGALPEVHGLLELPEFLELPETISKYLCYTHILLGVCVSVQRG